MEAEDFSRLPSEELLKKYEKTSPPKQRHPYDFIDNEGKTYVVLKEMPYNQFIGKISLLEKLKSIMGAISPHITEGKISPEVFEGSLKKKKAAEKIKQFLSSTKEEKQKKKEEIKPLEVEEEIELPEQPSQPETKPEEKPIASFPEEKEKLPETESSFHPVIKELVKDVVKQEYENIVIEDKETYSKVKEGVGISYIDNHKSPSVVCPCPEADIHTRSKEIVDEIYNNFAVSKKISKTELSKKLVDLTRLFLKAKSKSERDRIRAEIVEIKHTLKSKEARKKINPFAVLKERQKSSFEKLLNDIKSTFINSIKEAKMRYEEALSLSPSQSLRDKIEELRENDKKEIRSSFEQCVSKCSSFIIGLHKEEIRSLGEKLKLPESEIEKEESYITKEYSDRFESLKNDIEKALNESLSSSGLPQEKEEPKVVEEVPELELKTVNNYEMVSRDLETMGDAMWLHYLGKVNRRIFWKYVRGEMSKQEAVKKAKELYIKEKAKTLNLSDEEVSELMKKI